MSKFIPAQGSLSIGLLNEIRALIEESRLQTATAINMGLTLLYWRVGQRIRQDVLKGERAEYGKEILSTLSTELEPKYGRGFSARSLSRTERCRRIIMGITTQTIESQNGSRWLPFLTLS